MIAPVALAIATLLAVMPWPADRPIRHVNVTKRVSVEAPASWQARSEEYVLSVSAPSMPTDVYPPTVSITIETVSGDRKRLAPYVQAYYSHQWLMSENMTGWNTKDTTWDGLPASVAGYSTSYGGGTMTTKVIMAIDGDNAFVSRAMWMDDASAAAIDTALTVLGTTRRIPSKR